MKEQQIGPSLKMLITNKEIFVKNALKDKDLNFYRMHLEILKAILRLTSSKVKKKNMKSTMKR